jgi:hypothetical protein
MEKDEVLRKVQALLDKAESTGFTAEADAARAKADQLMLAYSIEMWELDKRRKPEQRATPEIRKFHICMSDNPVSEQLEGVFMTLCNHWRVRSVYYGFGRTPRKGQSPWEQYAKVVGFPQELDWLELMFTTMRLHIGTNLEPKPDPALDFEDNLVKMKEAGMKWERIHELLRPDVPWSRTHGVRYTKMYTDHCLINGKERMYTSPLTYQRNFVEGYRMQISSRLWDIRQYRQDPSGSGNGMELMLRDKKVLIDELYDETFKDLKSRKAKKMTFDRNAWSAGQKAGATADLGQERMGRGPREIGQ